MSSIIVIESEIDAIIEYAGYFIPYISSIVVEFIFGSIFPQKIISKGSYEDCLSILEQIDAMNIAPHNKKKIIKALFPSACRSANFKLMDLMLANDIDWLSFVGYICESGNVDSVDFILTRTIADANYSLNSINWGYAMYGACISGNRHLINLIFKKLEQPNLYEKSVEMGLHGACRAGNYDLAMLMMELGANEYIKALYCACSSGNTVLADKIIENIFGENKQKIDWDEALFSACYSGNMKMVEIVMYNHSIYCRFDQSALKELNWDFALLGACAAGHFYIAREAILRGAKNFNGALYAACRSGNKDLAFFIFGRKSVNAWDEGFEGACISGNLAIIDMIMGEKIKKTDRGIECAYKYGNMSAIILFIDMNLI